MRKLCGVNGYAALIALAASNAEHHVQSCVGIAQLIDVEQTCQRVLSHVHIAIVVALICEVYSHGGIIAVHAVLRYRQLDIAAYGAPPRYRLFKRLDLLKRRARDIKSDIAAVYQRGNISVGRAVGQVVLAVQAVPVVRALHRAVECDKEGLELRIYAARSDIEQQYSAFVARGDTQRRLRKSHFFDKLSVRSYKRDAVIGSTLLLGDSNRNALPLGKIQSGDVRTVDTVVNHYTLVHSGIRLELRSALGRGIYVSK